MRQRRLGKPKRSAELQAHWNAVAELGCIVTGEKFPTIQHCHGGSLRFRGIVHKGLGQKTADWLVIPLSHHLHVGAEGIDGPMGVVEWERRYGTQLYWLTVVCARLGVDVFERAGLAHPGPLDRWPVPGLDNRG